jgi:hypothetical protein
MQGYPDHHRSIARRGSETCVVDLVIDRAPVVDPAKVEFGTVRVDTLREIAANKICALIGRSEIRDLVDLRALLAAGVSLDDAAVKERGADPGTLAYILDELRIAPQALLPDETDPVELDRFRVALLTKLRALAFQRTRRD